MSLDDLLQDLLGGAGAGQRSGGSGDPLADMLQAILDGSAGSGAQQGGGIEDILGGLLGGGAAAGQPQTQASSQAGAGNLMDIISAALGGAGGPARGQSSSIIEGLAGKTGLSQMLVQLVLSFVMSKLLGGGAGLGGLLAGAGSGAAAPQGRQAAGLDLNGLLEQMSQDSSMADELAQKAGIDKATAQKSLQEVLAALSQQRRDQDPGSGQAKSGGMDDLLFKPNR